VRPPKRRFSRRRMRMLPDECNCLELSRLLGVDRKTILNWVKGGLRASHPFRNGQWAIRADDLKAFLVSTNRLPRGAS